MIKKGVTRKLDDKKDTKKNDTMDTLVKAAKARKEKQRGK